MEVPRRDAAAGEWRAPSTAGNRKKIARRPGNRKGPAERPGEECGKAAKAAGKQRKAAAAGAKPGYGEQPGEARKRVREPRKSRKATPVCRMFHDITLSHEMKILITGAAGFIGYHLSKRLLEAGNQVVGIDSINDYYDVRLKYARLETAGIHRNLVAKGQPVQSDRYPAYRFIQMHLEDRQALQNLFGTEKFDAVVNLAAQAGVRYSIENPYAYIDSNIVGFLNLLECVRHNPVRHFVYASSSSVYGGNTKTPFSEEDRVDNPVSLYAATKKSNELMAHVYSGLYGIPTTGLRFFTVYGPWGRPDMAPMLFAGAIREGRPIKVFNHGNLSRDFTYIDDIIEGMVRVIGKAPAPTQDRPIPAEVYNIGCGHPVQLMDFIHTLEETLGKKARMQMLPMQEGDVHTTYADTSNFERDFGYKPNVSLKEGIKQFIAWYLETPINHEDVK